MDGIELETGKIIEYEERKLEYRYIIGKRGNFKTVSAAVAWLGTGTNMKGPTELLIDGGSYPVNNTLVINLPYHLNIRGFDSESVTFYADTGLTNKPMLQIYGSVWIERVTADGSTLANYGTLSTENAIENLGSFYNKFTLGVLKGFYDGIKLIGANSGLWTFDSILENINGAGIHVYSDGFISVDVETNNFKNCAKCISLDKSPSCEWHLINNLFINGVGGIGVYYNPTTFTHYDGPVGFGNTWNNIGLFSQGFDYTRADGRDANVFVLGNSGREDKKPHFKVNVVNNLSGTIITTAGTFYKAVFINGTTYTCKWKLENNKATYLPVNHSDIPLWLNGVISTNGTNRNVTICIRKNNTTNYSPVTVRCPVQDQPYSFGLVAYIEDIGPTDYLEIFITSTSNGDIVNLKDFTIYTDSK